MSDFKEELIKVSVHKETESGVELLCTIEKKLFMTMFGSYDFKRSVEEAISRRIVSELPIELLNQILDKISLDSVAKLATLDMAALASGQQRR